MTTGHEPTSPADDESAFGDETAAATPSQETTAALTLEAGPRVGDASADHVGDTIHRYQLHDTLGSGGMGVVYEAHDPELERSVALKLIHPRQAGIPASRGHRRLAREARALARLSHPNIVAVYDAGRHEDSVFIAMEMVVGQSLARWCRSEPRPHWRAVVAAYVAAARGLAAAHDVGMLHRDFKPDNVLIADDGTVKVADFGIAALTAPEPDARDAPSAPASPSSSEPAGRPRDLVAGSLTAPGALLGTPLYMAPEQQAGGPLDPRADQYSFFLSLYRGLYEQSPFRVGDGETAFRELLEHKMAGDVAPPPADTEVPGWLYPIIVRGLAPDPDDRWPSMDDAIRALQSDPDQRRRRRITIAAVAALVLAVIAIAAAGWLRGVDAPADPALLCQTRGADIDGVWDPVIAEELTRTHGAPSDAHVRSAAARLTDRLDDYADQWRAMRIEACDTQQRQDVRADGSLDLRMRCLDRRRARLHALVSMVRRRDGPGPPPGELLDAAIQAALSLPPITDCGDIATLRTAIPPPDDLRVRVQVDAIASRLDRATAARETGRYALALETAQAALAAIGGDRPTLGDASPTTDPVIDYPPVRARAMFEVALARVALGEARSSETMLRAILPVAAAAKDDVLIARTWSAIITLLSYDLGRPLEAMRWIDVAEMAAERVDDPKTRAEVWLAIGEALRNVGDFDAALTREQAALALLSDGDHLQVTSALDSIAVTLLRLGRFRESLEHQQRAVALAEDALGSDHPQVADHLKNMGIVLEILARNDEARAAYERASKIYQRTLRSDHPRIANQLGNVGVLALNLGEKKKALEYLERAVTVSRQRYDPEHPLVALASVNLGLALASFEIDRERAHSLYERALAMQEKRLPADHPDAIQTRFRRAALLDSMGQIDAAHSELEHCLTATDQSLGPDHPRNARLLVHLARIDLRRSRYRDGVERMRRALEIFRQTLTPDHPELAQAMHLLGALLVKSSSLGEAAGYYAESLAIFEKNPATTPLMIANALNSLGVLQLEQGLLLESRATLARSRDAGSTALGPKSAFVADVMLNQSTLEIAAGQYTAAIALIDRARPIHEATRGPRYVQITSGMAKRAVAMHGQGESAQAMFLLEKALARQLEHFGPRHARIGEWRSAMADILAQRGQRARARTLYRDALTVLEEVHGEGHFKTTPALLGLAELDLAEDNLTRATEISEHAFTICQSATHRCRWRAGFTLAQTSWAAGIERERAMRLARSALRAYNAVGNRIREEQVNRWLDTHEPRMKSNTSRPISDSDRSEKNDLLTK